jgi:phosphatidylserine decarboxylase
MAVQVRPTAPSLLPIPLTLSPIPFSPFFSSSLTPIPSFDTLNSGPLPFFNFAGNMNWRIQVMALLPKNALSLWVGWVVRQRWPLGIHTALRNLLIRIYRIDVHEAEKPLEAYPTFGSFFIRRLKPTARAIASVELISPVDGLVTQRGSIDSGRLLIQAKGLSYSLTEFMPLPEAAERFFGGFFMTIYLAPYNYHRIHSPCDMTVNHLLHIPGALWPVNSWSVTGISKLFVRNERVMVQGEAMGGDVLVAMVGATNVGRITLDAIPNFHSNHGKTKDITPLSFSPNWQLSKAAPLGCFEMGSTVILLLGPKWKPRLADWVLQSESRVIRMGESLLHT